MLDELQDNGYLSAQQFEAASGEGDFFLLACPGSGKTRTAGARFAELCSRGDRVAATSYTNVGVEEVRSVISGDLGVVVPPSCFTGTLHSLLLRYVYYPFAHRVMGCTQPPRLMVDGGPWPDVVFDGNNKVRMPVSYFAFRPDGSLCVRRRPKRFPYDKEAAAQKGQEQALRLKTRAAGYGLATFEDSMYWALRVLEEDDRLASAVASRFEEIVVDEAQDAGELQLAAVERIWKTGRLSSLVLVGDIEQSMLAFRGRAPGGCEALIERAGLRTTPLTENHRSSQRICDVAACFCLREAPDEAVGPDGECDLVPELFL